MKTQMIVKTTDKKLIKYLLDTLTNYPEVEPGSSTITIGDDLEYEVKAPLCCNEQPIVMVDGVERYKANKIVEDLYDISEGMNEIWKKGYPEEDLKQFYQLIGYSVCGFAEVFGENQ